LLGLTQFRENCDEKEQAKLPILGCEKQAAICEELPLFNQQGVTPFAAVSGAPASCIPHSGDVSQRSSAGVHGAP